jgi:hypothetical protein
VQGQCSQLRNTLLILRQVFAQLNATLQQQVLRRAAAFARIHSAAQVIDDLWGINGQR